jgi:hypothetical protein
MTGASGRTYVRVHTVSRSISRKEVRKIATGKKAASDAGKVLADPKATKAEKTAAASDLVQAPSSGKKK